MSSEDHIERTFLMIKPDGVQRGLVGEIVARLEQKGLELRALKLKNLDIETAKKHYAEHRDKAFYDHLVYYITSGPIIIMALEGFNAVRAVRQLVGATTPIDAAPGSLRGDFCLEQVRNLVHAADSPEAASRELALHFSPEDYVSEMRVGEPNE
ncbi:MAG TPA: nucleoside-diphosphate kinase [Candidatus Bathyarchaeia archaeon]|nr:nucleoside-diphosphate kinase [Candidatus Bathyarchaeia archaeon]